MSGLAAARMSGGSEFHATGPAREKARSPNLVRNRGVTYLLLEADRRPVHVAALMDVQNNDVFEIPWTSCSMFIITITLCHNLLSFFLMSCGYRY